MHKSKCPKCGQIIDEKSRQCTSCGFDVLQGDTTATFISPPELESKEEIEVGPLKENEEAVLVIKKGPVIGQRIPLTQDELMIGRDPQSDLFLNDITVSRKHAKLVYLKGNVEIKDVGSLNGTYVNNELTESSKLKSGDEIQIGKFVLVFLSK